MIAYVIMGVTKGTKNPVAFAAEKTKKRAEICKREQKSAKETM